MLNNCASGMRFGLIYVGVDGEYNGVDILEMAKIFTTQGSILHPLFFIMYINSLPSVLKASKTYLYAGDMATVTQETIVESISATLSGELQNANCWPNNHKLPLNEEKTRVMYFGRQHHLSKENLLPITLPDVEMQIASDYKYLSTYLDSLSI